MSLLQRCKACCYPIKPAEEVTCSACNGIVHIDCSLVPHSPPGGADSASALPRVCRMCDCNNTRTSLALSSAQSSAPCDIPPLNVPEAPLNTTHFTAIMEQLSVMSAAINKCNVNLDALKTQISSNTLEIAEIKNENALLRSKISSLESQLDNININTSTAEISERIRRENNVIIFGLPLQSSTEQDLLAANKLLCQIAPEQNVTAFKGVRIGKGRDSTRPKPFKATLSSKEDVTKVLKAKHKVARTEFPNVKIKNDLTPKQLKELSDLRSELARRQNNGEPNLTIKYVRGVPTIIRAENVGAQKRGRDEDSSPTPNKGTKINKHDTK